MESNDRLRMILGFEHATDADLAKLSEQKKQILLLIHNQWVTNRELILKTGATEATRRIREMDAEGYDIKRRRHAESGRWWEYMWNGKMLEETKEQKEFEF